MPARSASSGQPPEGGSFPPCREHAFAKRAAILSEREFCRETQEGYTGPLKVEEAVKKGWLSLASRSLIRVRKHCAKEFASPNLCDGSHRAVRAPCSNTQIGRYIERERKRGGSAISIRRHRRIRSTAEKSESESLWTAVAAAPWTFTRPVGRSAACSLTRSLARSLAHSHSHSK